MKDTTILQQRHDLGELMRNSIQSPNLHHWAYDTKQFIANFWRNFSQPDLALGVRATATVLVPLLGGFLAGQPVIGLMVAFGGLNVSPADTAGAYQTKAIHMSVATLCVATAALL